MFNERLIPWFGTGTADALFLKKQANVCWASGFMGKDSCVLMTPDGGFLFTDPRYTEQAGIEAPDFTLVNWRAVGGSMMKALAHVIKEQKIGSVGFEADTLSFGEYSELQGQTDARLVPTENVVEELRSIKAPEEIGYLRASCEIACRAFDRILDDIRVGVTEKELAARLAPTWYLRAPTRSPTEIS